MTTRTVTALAPAARRSTIRSVAVGTAFAVALVALMFGLANLAGAELIVEPPGRPAGPAPIAAGVAGAILGGLAALALAMGVRRLPRPRVWFLAATTVALAVSFTSPFESSAQTSTAIWLSVMHVSVYLAIVPLTVRTLPGGAR